jgi:hypothetical protein
MRQHLPQNFDQYIRRMKQREVKVIPSINRQNQLQGFRFEFKGYNLKGSEVHRSMSGGKLAMELSKNANKEIIVNNGKAILLLGKVTQLSVNLALKIAKHTIKKTIKKGMEIGY